MDKNIDLNNLISWLNDHELKASTYVPKDRKDHPILRETDVVHNIIIAIKRGDLNAIELGCDLVIENKHVPFGRTLKSNILTSLKKHVRFISKDRQRELSLLAIVLLNDDYPPKEVKALCKLIKRFDIGFVQLVLDGTISKTKEAQRWVNYLQI